MKRTIGVLLGLGVVSAVGYFAIQNANTLEVINENSSLPEVVEEFVQPPTPAEVLEQAIQSAIESAVTASSSDIAAAREEAADQAEATMKLEIEKQVRESIDSQNDDALEDIDKTLGVY